MTTGQKVAAQLDELDSVREDLIDALEDKGVVIDPDAKLEEITEKIEDIPTDNIIFPTNTNYDTAINFQNNGSNSNPVNMEQKLAQTSFKPFKNMENLFYNTAISYLDFTKLKEFHPKSLKNAFYNMTVMSPNSSQEQWKGQGYLDFRGVDFSECTNLSYAFREIKFFRRTSSSGTYALKRDTVNLYFDNINTSNVTDMSYMFYRDYESPSTTDGSSIKKIYGLGTLDFSKVTNVTCMFGDINYFEFYEKDENGEYVLQDGMYLKNKTFSALTNAYQFMSNSGQYHYIFNPSNQNRNIYFENLSFPNLTNIEYAFVGGSGGEIAPPYYVHNYLDKIIMKNVTMGKQVDRARQFISRMTHLEEIDVSGLTFNNGIIDCTSMFYSNVLMTTFKMFNCNFNKTTSMSFMFQKCRSITDLDLPQINAGSSVSCNYNGMFDNCTALVNLNLPNLLIYNSNSNCASMFNGCTSLQHLDMRKFEFSKITNANYRAGMFTGVPTDCEIIVKNSTEKDWFTTNFPSLTNVKTVSEYEAEQGGAS